MPLAEIVMVGGPDGTGAGVGVAAGGVGAVGTAVAPLPEQAIETASAAMSKV